MTTRGLAVIAALCWVIVLILAFMPRAGQSAGGDVRYERAHAAAVKYRSQRDDLQARLAFRVREVHALRRALVHRPGSVEALELAAIAYDVPFRLLYRIASCESTGTYVGQTGPVSERSLYARAKNPHSTARGLGQFLDSTWASTPYSGFDVNSPYANALAIANEVAHGNQHWQWAASARCWS